MGVEILHKPLSEVLKGSDVSFDDLLDNADKFCGIIQVDEDTLDVLNSFDRVSDLMKEVKQVVSDKLRREI